MRPRLRPHDPLQPHQIICGLHHIRTVVQGQFILARRVFRNHRLSRDPGLRGPGIDVGKQRQHPVQMVDRIDFGLAAGATIQNVAGRDHLAIRASFVFQQEKFQLECTGWEVAFSGHRIDLRLQGVARVRRHP